jgi:hypothetical protein
MLSIQCASFPRRTREKTFVKKLIYFAVLHDNVLYQYKNNGKVSPRKVFDVTSDHPRVNRGIVSLRAWLHRP